MENRNGTVLKDKMNATDDILKRLDDLINKNLTADVMKDMDRCIDMLNSTACNKTV